MKYKLVFLGVISLGVLSACNDGSSNKETVFNKDNAVWKTQDYDDFIDIHESKVTLYQYTPTEWR